MTVWMYVTQDKYELPIYVADSVKELAKLVGTRSDGERDPGSLESRIRKIGKRAGVENVHPHRFRRTGATMALRAGMPLMEVSQILGHESVGTTQIYLDIDNQQLESTHEKYVI